MNLLTSSVNPFRFSVRACVIAKSVAAWCALCALWNVATPVFAERAVYAVVRQDADGVLGLVNLQFVDMAAAASPVRAPDAGSRQESFLDVRLIDRVSGETTLQSTSVASPWLRGEFHGAASIDGKHLPAADRSYVVRVPMQDHAILRIDAVADNPAVDAALKRQPAIASRPKRASAPSRLEIDLETESATLAKAGASGVSARALAGTATGSLISTGSPANRLDLLIVAEGYTAAQQSQFVQQATDLANAFLSISPYADFRQLINVSWLFVPSNQSGADKPDCAETPGQPVVAVDTAFDATFCTSGIRRLLTANESKVFAAAAAVPDWDKIMVLVNDTEYGGSGGSISVVSTNSLSSGIAQHEFGHSFSLLADEYTTAYPGYPACSDAANSTSTCEPNVTDQSTLANLKWAGWVSSTTPVPTVSALADPIAAGLWLGARYQASGMYRQCYNGIMQSLGRPFCHVDSEAFVKRLYAGGWGVPASGVNLIEPGSLPSASTLNGANGTAINFQASIAGSASANTLSAQWIVDGVATSAGKGGNGAVVSLPYNIPDQNSHSVELRVSDSTPMLLNAQTRSRQWNFGAPPPQAKRGGVDIDGDGKGEIVVRSANAQLQVGRWVNNTLQFTPLADPGANYRLVGIGDFDGDGQSDLAFQDMTQGTLGDIKIWKSFSPSNVIFWRQVKQVWDVQAVGDLDGDGFGDLVWRYVVTDSPDTGVSYIWFTSGSGVTQVRKRGGAPLDWKLLGAADLNHDGAADMVYINPSNQARALMATPNRTCANLLIGTLPTGFTALKLADFTGNRRGDILLRNAATGRVQLLALNGGGLVLPPYTGAPDDQNAACTGSALTVASSTITLPSSQPGWSYFASVDLDGDGINDIVWKTSTGALVVWIVSASGTVTQYLNAGTAPAGYTVVQP